MARLVCALLLLAVATATASESRIVGGTPTSVERYPWIVQGQRSLTGIWSQHCAGTILTSRFVVSAASCYIGPSFIVRLRRILAGSSIRNEGGQLRSITRVVQHPLWNVGLNFDGDIAVVELETPLLLTAVVQQASILGQGAFVPDNMPGVQVGWGMTFNQDFPSIFAPQVQELNVFTVNNAVCAQNYANAPIPQHVTSNMICAASIGDSGACFGDKGGPLFISNILVGVVSFGLGCSNSTFPTLHAAIPAFTNWIIATAQ